MVLKPCIFVLAAGLASARPATDVLVMRNGDRVTCEVKSLEAGVLRVNLDYVDGTISVDWLKVARIESNNLFLIQLKDGSIYSTTVVTPDTLEGTPVKLSIQEQDHDAFLVERSDVVRITQTSESFLQRIGGNISVGALYSKGNNTTQYNFGSELDYIRERWGSRILYSSNLSSSTGAPAATRNQLDMTAYRLFPWKNYFYAGTAGFLQSSVQGIQRQTALGLGVGRYLKNTNRVTFTLMAGFGWQRTTYTESGQQNVGVGILSTNLKVFSFKKNRLDLSASILPAVTGVARSFAKINTTYYLKLFGKFDWNLSFYGNWDTNPPAHLPASDYGSSTGLSWTFGPK